MVLYDFIYLDKKKIFSYYAQLFDGLLKNVSDKQSTSSTEKEKVSGGLKPFAEGSMEGVKSFNKENTKEIDPEELVIIDTLAILSKNSKPLRECHTGDILKENGNLFIATNNILEVFVDIMDLDTITGTKSVTKQEKKEANELKRLMKAVFSKISIEPIFILKDDSSEIVGSIKQEFLNEDPDTFQIKHGGAGLDDIQVLGIYENRYNNQSDREPSSFIDSSRVFANGIKEAFFPANSSVITPIAIYREVKIEE